MNERNADNSQNDRSEHRRREERLAGDFPSSRAHHAEPSGTGPTPDEQLAEDSELAAQERGAHAEKPVGGSAKDADRP